MNKYISQLKQVLSEILFKEFQPYSFRSKVVVTINLSPIFSPVISNDKNCYVFDNAILFRQV